MKQKSTTFYCFSPPVMLATFLIESGLLVYVVWRYKMSALARLVVTILAALATFQLAEYYICGGMGASAIFWSRVGFVAITLLPPLGLHVMHQLAKKPAGALVYTAYAVAALWVVVFVATSWAFDGQECGGNYVIFRLNLPATWFYGLYYYGLLLGGIYWALTAAKGQPKPRSRALVAMILGYFVFLVPTATANMVRPETMAAIPSIMCGFAVVFAGMLVLWVLPMATTEHDRRWN